MKDQTPNYISPAEIYAKYVDANSNVIWPEEQREKMLLVRAIFGAWLIGRFDWQIAEAFDFIENTESQYAGPRKNLLAKRDAYFRAGLASLTVEQKAVVKQLALETIFGTLFGALVTLDQTRYGQYLLSLQTEVADGISEVISVAPNNVEELHDDLNEWVLGFSKYASQITQLIDVKGGKQFSPIRPYG